MNGQKIYKSNFICHIIDQDLSYGKYKSIHTRFPPEPNGYLHIGHAKSICLNFGIAQDYKGKCNLRFDDTNPLQEHEKYIETIKNDIIWLGFKWNNDVHYTSDYFELFYKFAMQLIKCGLAYVDELSPEKIREYRGELTSSGKNSPYRCRDIQENLVLFSKMRDGGFLEGCACLRAKINMSSPSIIMRDPILYRVKFINHHRWGDKWCIYPTYDFTHCISDALEGITHSLCTLEFQDNRKLYNWILNKIKINSTQNPSPSQYEFSRLNLEYFVMSKRKLNLLVLNKFVDGWDDPRMPTIAGLRRKGYTPQSIRDFCYNVGVTKQEHCIEISALENCIRKDLDKYAPRAMAVLHPIKMIIINLHENYEENIIVPNHPNRINMGTREIVFTKEIFIDRNDVCDDLNYDNTMKKLILGERVRLRHAYVVQAKQIKKNNLGEIIEIFCIYDPDTLNRNLNDYKYKIKGIIHWVSAVQNISAEFRLYSHLFKISNPFLLNKQNFLSYFNPESLIICQGFVEKSISYFNFRNKHYQFEREGYFYIDINYSSKDKLVFHRTVKLKKKFYKI